MKFEHLKDVLLGFLFSSNKMNSRKDTKPYKGKYGITEC